MALVHANGQDFQALVEKSLQNAETLPGVEIEFLDTLWIGDPAALGLMKVKKAEFSRTFRYSLITFGTKYHARCELVSATETNLVKLQETAFDGTT